MKMKEKPILFKGDMVRAILEGRKTETRRIVKPIHKKACGFNVVFNHDDSFHGVLDFDEDEMSYDNYSWPYGQVGDRLWVRETIGCYQGGVVRRADNEYNSIIDDDPDLNWTPSIFMPWVACRLFLEITEISVERVRDITTMSAINEGIHQTIGGFMGNIPAWANPEGEGHFYDNRTSIENFRNLWDSINKKRGFSWKSNPWVWVIKFKVVK